MQATGKAYQAVKKGVSWREPALRKGSFVF